jgi:hypothetical protein
MRQLVRGLGRLSMIVTPVCLFILGVRFFTIPTLVIFGVCFILCFAYMIGE